MVPAVSPGSMSTVGADPDVCGLADQSPLRRLLKRDLVGEVISS